MSKDNTMPLYVALGCLTIIVLVCIWLIASPTSDYKKYTLALEVAEQQHKRELADLDRRLTLEHQRLQEQINSLEYIVSKNRNLTDDDLKGMKRDIHDVQERLKARNR